MASSAKPDDGEYQGTSVMASSILAQIDSLTPAAACQLFYMVGTMCVLAIAILPDSAKGLLLSYGPRQLQHPEPSDDMKSTEGTVVRKNPSTSVARDGRLIGFLDWATSIGKVPHSWFTHFYILSVTCSAFWGLQFLTDGRILRAIAGHGRRSETGMTEDQVILTWLLMSLQGGRRLYESWFVMRSSSSRMWFIHYALGIAFYFFTSIAIWAEASYAILDASNRSVDLDMPSPRTLLGIVAFFVAWTWQSWCHIYLSNLKKYSLPEEGLFRFIVSPHYTCECALYMSLAIVAAPVGRSVNRTLLCAVMFVAANLGATAGGTKQWYSEKFGDEKVRGKWKMIPLVY